MFLIGFLVATGATNWFTPALPGASISKPTAAPKIQPGFAFHQVTIQVAQAGGQPVAGASLYGFCRELNLIWPRPKSDAEWADVNVWHQSYLGKTDSHGRITANIPPGKWAFFATAILPGDSPKALVVWTNYREANPDETIQLAPTTLKSWSFCLPNGLPATPKDLFFKPTDLPIWIPVKSGASGSSWQVEMSAGTMGIWGAGDSAGQQPGFALNWGTLNAASPNGKILPAGKSATMEFKGGQGRSAMTWSALHNYGLEGELALDLNAKVVLSTGDYTLGYRRPVAKTFMGTFAGELYSFKGDDGKVIDLDTPLTGALDQDLPAPPVIDEEGDGVVTESTIKLYAQLYLVDGNEKLLSALTDAAGQPARFSASLTMAGKSMAAETMPDKTTIPNGGQTLFAVTFPTAPSGAQNEWTITAPPGILTDSHFAPAAKVIVSSATFKVTVPKILAARARNLLAQAEMAARTMSEATRRSRKESPTNLIVTPGHRGASASLNGRTIRIGTKLLFSDSIILRHDFIHELGHNFNFTHGGLHETSNETTRCAATDQISEQPAKWMFMDRMNGIAHKEVSYRNTGLYLYAYAQGGGAFLRFMSLNEYSIINKLKNEFSADEVATALLGLALDRDMSGICASYGLKVTSARVVLATTAARPLCQIP